MKCKYAAKSSRGAVTVFLTLILIPCMIFVCAFGDASRVFLSRSQAAGAADLALYSLMANYDEELKEWYGLVASCQSIEEFYDVSAEYFVGMMSAKGLDDTASDTLLAYLDAARNGDFANFLQLEGLDKVKVTSVADGALGGNPALIENGIVEFMKYRGPIVIVQNLIDRFKNMDSLGLFDGLFDANENEPIMEAKQDYAEAEGEMMNDLLYSFLAIEQYMDYRAENGVPDMYKYQHEYGEKLSHILEDFGCMTDTITKYYAATDGIENISLRTGYDSFPLYDLPSAGGYAPTSIQYDMYTYTMSDIGAVLDVEIGGYYLSHAALTELLSNKDLHVNNVKEAAARIEDACKDIVSPAGNSDVNEAVYCMLMQSAIKAHYNDLHIIHNDGKALMQLYAKLILAQRCHSVLGSLAVDGRISSAMAEISGIQREYLSYNNNPSGGAKFEQLLSQYKTTADATVENVKQRRYEFYSSYSGRNMTVGQFLEAIRGDIGTLVGHLDKQIANVNTILNGGRIRYPINGGKEYTVVSLNTLKEKIIAYSTARDNWGDEANRHDTDYARSERDEYNGVEAPGAHEGESNDIRQARTTSTRRSAALYEDGAESVEELRTRLTNIKSDMQTLRDVLQNCTYGGEKFYTLDRNTAISVAQNVIPTTVDSTRGAYIEPLLSQNASAAQGYHRQLMNETEYTAPRLISGPAGNEPDLKEDIPSLYQYMSEAVNKDNLENAVSEKEKQEKENEENQNKANEAAKNSKGFDSAFLDDLGENGPKETSGSNSFGMGTVLTSLVGMVQNLLGGNFDEFRDQLYVCAYIMEMFSYSSYNNEGQYSLSSEPLTLGDYKKSEKRFSEELQNKWKETDPTKLADNKTLTNRMINSTNNRSNLAEVEYILYGKATNKDNLEAAYGDIFVIREALNLVSGFANFYSGTSPTALAIQGIAASVMALTMGFIPEALTKVVLIGVLATMETARDMDRLKAGTPVVIYKMKEENWTYKLPANASSITSIFSGEGFEDPKDENGFFYSDYLILFLLISSGSSGMYPDMLLRVGDLIEGNMATQEGKGEYDLEKAQCYFQMAGKVSVKPLLMKLPLVTNFSGADASKLFEVTDWCSYSLDVVRGYS